MAKNSGNKKKGSGGQGKSGAKGGGFSEKSFFRVEDGRAMKAKKNKAFVKFNKVSWQLALTSNWIINCFLYTQAKVQIINQESISRLNQNLDSLQTTVRSSRKDVSVYLVGGIAA